MGAENYKDLIRIFLEGRLGAVEFTTRYREQFLAEPGGMNKALFTILEDLFEDVDAYSPTWSPADENPYRITEGTLRQEAMQAMAALDQYFHDRANSG